jgi:hypothetical protein
VWMRRDDLSNTHVDPFPLLRNLPRNGSQYAAKPSNGLAHARTLSQQLGQGLRGRLAPRSPTAVRRRPSLRPLLAA